MRKYISFRINNKCDDNNIYPGFDIDYKNGYIGEYLGIYNIEGKNLLFSRVIGTADSIDVPRKTIRVNEVDYNENEHYDKNSNRIQTQNFLYYNLNESNLIHKLQELLNTTKVFNQIENGSTIADILSYFEIEYQKSNIEEIIEDNFQTTRSYIYPSDYDYQKRMDEHFGKNNYNEYAIRRIPMKRIKVTGINENVFNYLKRKKTDKKANSYIK